MKRTVQKHDRHSSEVMDATFASGFNRTTAYADVGMCHAFLPIVCLCLQQASNGIMIWAVLAP